MGFSGVNWWGFPETRHLDSFFSFISHFCIAFFLESSIHVVQILRRTLFSMSADYR